MKHRKIISSAIIASMIANTMSWAFYVSLINIALTPKIFAADAIFDQLENNFNLANPNANRNATTVLRILWKSIKMLIPGKI